MTIGSIIAIIAIGLTWLVYALWLLYVHLMCWAMDEELPKKGYARFCTKFDFMWATLIALTTIGVIWRVL